MKIFGTHEQGTIQQLTTCVEADDNAIGVLCADGHIGYSMPIGGVVAYRDKISPSGVGYDIACGNMAVKTNILAQDVYPNEMRQIADRIADEIAFGVGRKNNKPLDAPVLDMIKDSPCVQQRGLRSMAAAQLGTVGSGNHYVDVLEDEDGYLWVANHFGSRGFGHKTATGFLNLAKGADFSAHGSDGEMFSPPVLLSVHSQIGQDYIAAMNIAGEYAYEGRRQVVQTVLDIIGAKAVDTVHNHHNFAWQEQHGGASYWVVRKGATPAQPGQRGFVGGSMGDISVILEGVDSPDASVALYSTMHGAGRVMSRNQAIKGKHQWACKVESLPSVPCAVAYLMPRDKDRMPKNMKCPVHDVALIKEQLTPPVNFRDVQDRLTERGIILRGAGPDESPAVYRPLRDVLAAHAATIKVTTILQPRIVVMAGKDIKDPYKD